MCLFDPNVGSCIDKKNIAQLIKAIKDGCTIMSDSFIPESHHTQVSIFRVIIDDATGWPVPEVRIWASRHERVGDEYKYEHLEAENETDENGEFVFSNMSPFQYNLETGLKEIPEGNKATGGQKELVKIRVVIPEWSDLRPRKPELIIF